MGRIIINNYREDINNKTATEYVVEVLTEYENKKELDVGDSYYYLHKSGVKSEIKRGKLALTINIF